MTSDFTVGDATKYKAIITGNEIKIRDLNQFLKDWREIKIKAEKYDELEKMFKIYTGELCWQQDRFIGLFKKLEAIKTYTEREFKAGYLIKPIDILKIL